MFSGSGNKGGGSSKTSRKKKRASRLFGKHEVEKALNITAPTLNKEDGEEGPASDRSNGPSSPKYKSKSSKHSKSSKNSKSKKKGSRIKGGKKIITAPTDNVEEEDATEGSSSGGSGIKSSGDARKHRKGSVIRLGQPADNAWESKARSRMQMAVTCLSVGGDAREHGLKVLAQLGLEQCNHQLLRAAIPSLVPLLSEEEDDVVRMFAAFALANLSVAPNNQSAVCEAGAIPILVRLLASHNADILEKTLWLLGNVCRQLPARRQAVAAGVLPALVPHLSHSSLSVVRHTLLLLRNLCHEATVHPLLVGVGGLRALCHSPLVDDAQLAKKEGTTGTISAATMNARAQWAALVSVLSYYSADLRRDLVRLGAHHPLLNMLSSSTSNFAPICTHVIHALTNLSVDSTLALCDAGTVQKLAELLSTQDDASLCGSVCAALANLAVYRGTSVAGVLLQQGPDVYEPQLVRLNQLVIDGKEKQVPVATAIFNATAALSRVPEMRHRLVRAGVLATGEKMLEKKHQLAPTLKNAVEVAVHNLKLPIPSEQLSSLQLMDERRARNLAAAQEKESSAANTESLAKNRQHRARVVNEILGTEKNYVNTLNTITNVYMIPLEEVPEKICTRAERKKMFPIMDILLQVHTEFLSNLETRVLEQRQNADVLLGDIFLNLAEVLKVYRTFINNYDAASNCLAECMARSAFLKWVEAAQESAKTKNLASMLITPIQRIPRYCLLLADLIKHMPKDHADRSNCSTALNQIEEIADYLDKEKDKAVSKSKLRYMEKHIANLGIQDLSEYSWRRFYREGPLIMEKDNKSSEYVYLWLLTDMLIMTTQKGRKHRMREYYTTETMAIFNLPDESDEELDRNAFQVLTDKGSIVLYTTKADEKEEWMTDLRAATIENKKRLHQS